jgi:hypothetical protein
MGQPEALGYQGLNELANQFVSSSPEHLFSLSVDRCDAAGTVHGHDRIQKAFKEGFKKALGLHNTAA